jgi:WhiB family transcriptional regulator, redox-sensing transcriptional regulator
MADVTPREVPWQDLGACRSFGVELFYPPTDQDGDDAKAVCLTCSVRERCLEFALAAGERFGIWGGMTPQERRYLIARRRRTTTFESLQEEEHTVTVS